MKSRTFAFVAFALLPAAALGGVSVITVGGTNPGPTDNQNDLVFLGYTGPPPGDCAEFVGLIVDAGTISCDQVDAGAMAAAIAAGMNANLAAGWTVVSTGATITITSPPGTDFTCRVGSTEEANACADGYDVPLPVNNVCAGGNVANGRTAHTAGWNFNKKELKVTVDVKCGGDPEDPQDPPVKIGEFTLSSTGCTNTGTKGGCSVTGGFTLTDTRARDVECWCKDYYWFQAIKVSDNTFGPAEDADEFVDALPGQGVGWGGGNVVEDFCPFYFTPGAGGCGNDVFVNHDGKTLFYDDHPWWGLANVMVGTPFTFEARLCLACVTDDIEQAGPNGGQNTCKDEDGEFKVLACIEWGFTITHNMDGTFSVTADGPDAGDASVTPQWVTTALTTFNKKAMVGTWSITEESRTCPPFQDQSPRKRPDPRRPGLGTTRTVLCSYEPSAQTLTIAEAGVEFLNQQGLAPITSPIYSEDPVLNALLGGGVYRLAQVDGERRVFFSDANFMNLYFDDPNDRPDSKTLGDGVTPSGNPNGWEAHANGTLNALIFDPGAEIPLYATVLDPTLDTQSSQFISDLQEALTGTRTLAYFYQPDIDLAQATEDFTVPAVVNGAAFLAVAVIPTVSEWGVIVMTLLLLTGVTLKFGRRREVARGAA